MATMTLKELHELFRYDPETGHLYLKKSRKFGFDPNKPAGSICNGYLRIKANGKDMLGHRAVWGMHYGALPDGEIDHIDRNPLNNRIDNLRLATRHQNVRNVGAKGVLNTKGVSWHKARRKFYARIRAGGTHILLGFFDSLDDAAHAYNKAAIQLHGEFAVLNPIGEDK